MIKEALNYWTNQHNGNYQVGLPWKEIAKIPNNRWLTEKQFYQMNDKLSKNAQLKKLYQETLENDLLNGYVIKIDPGTEDSDTTASFLPYHPLTKQNKPGKVRRVANASSVFQGQSLNPN